MMFSPRAKSGSSQSGGQAQSSSSSAIPLPKIYGPARLVATADSDGLWVTYKLEGGLPYHAYTTWFLTHDDGSTECLKVRNRKKLSVEVCAKAGASSSAEGDQQLHCVITYGVTYGAKQKDVTLAITVQKPTYIRCISVTRNPSGSQVIWAVFEYQILDQLSPPANISEEVSYTDSKGVTNKVTVANLKASEVLTYDVGPPPPPPLPEEEHNVDVRSNGTFFDDNRGPGTLTYDVHQDIYIHQTNWTTVVIGDHVYFGLIHHTATEVTKESTR